MTAPHIIFYKHKVNSDGSSPIIIYVQRKKRTLANVFEHQWDDSKKRVIPKTHDNYASINILISDEYNRLEKLILENNFDLKRDFLDYFDNKKSGVPEPEIKKRLSFIELIPKYVSTLKSGQSMIAYEAKLNYFSDKAGIGNLRLSEINRGHINKFVRYQEEKGNKNSTIRTNLRIVRFLAGFAKREGFDNYPDDLLNYKLPRAEKSIKRKPTIAELDKFKNWVTDDEKLRDMLKETQDLFMLSIYLRGMRISDSILLKQDYFQNGRLVYTSSKSKKHFNIKLVKEAQEIVSRYSDNREYLFSFFTWEDNKGLSYEENLKGKANHIKDITAIINKRLKTIAEKAELSTKVSTHMARHIFSKMALKQVDGDVNLGMAFTGHSTLKDYQVYVEEIMADDEMDDAADKIFS